MSLTVSQRITSMAFVALSALAIVGAYAIHGLHAGQQRFEFVQRQVIPDIDILTTIRSQVSRLRIASRDYVIADNSADKLAARKDIEATEKEIDGLLDKYEKNMPPDADDTKVLAEIRTTASAYYVELADVLAKVDAGDTAGIKRQFSPQGMYRQLGTRLRAALNDHVKYKQKQSENLRIQSTADYDRAFWIEVSLIVAAIVASGLLAFKIIGELRLRLSQLDAMTNKISNDLDFTVRMPVTRDDEIGKVGKAINTLAERLQGNLTTISNSAVSIAKVSQELAATSSQVAATALHQSSASADMAATIEQMTVSVNHVADRAGEANKVSAESGQLAHDGSGIITTTTSDIREISLTVNDAATKIRGLEEKTQEVVNIVLVIKEVAEQTNLLALNAAIEAARAGEQGRGFAVVADEVRKLAERTAASTREISDTIETMRNNATDAVNSMEGVVSKVDVGVTGAESAYTAIQRISEGSRKAVHMVDEITTAIREQGIATNSIARQVESIAQMSEEGSATASNTADSAKHLDRLSQEMMRIVDAYRL